MATKKRHDGRQIDETRPITAKVGVIKNADGSAYFQMGNTAAYAAVYGPRDLHPKFLQNPETGILRCNYNMMPFSSVGDRVRPGTSRRSKEISMVTEKALLPVLNLKSFPNSVVDVFIELPQTDVGSRCVGICAASLALADAGLIMKDLVAAVAVGRLNDEVLVDLDYSEENPDEGEATDIPIAVIPSTKELTLLQLDGEISKEQLYQALELGFKTIEKINVVQRNALAEKFKETTK